MRVKLEGMGAFSAGKLQQIPKSYEPHRGFLVYQQSAYGTRMHNSLNCSVPAVSKLIRINSEEKIVYFKVNIHL